MAEVEANKLNFDEEIAIDGFYYKTLEELKEKRNKLISIKRKKTWPEFVAQPVEVGPIEDDKSFKVTYPLVEGERLDLYLKKKDIDINECLKLIKMFEDKIVNTKKFVFPGIVDPSKIVIFNDNFINMNPSSVQISGKLPEDVSKLVVPLYDKIAAGMVKCRNNNRFNKQLDVRSVYALLYYLINASEYFYPPFFDAQGISHYTNLLEKMNIPKKSKLYERTMLTLNLWKVNKPIDDALEELIEEGYCFETIGENSNGYCHRLVKK